jgi:hypothetical protein
MKDPLMKDESQAKSVRAKNLFCILNYLFYYCTSDNEKAFEFCTEAADIDRRKS